MERDRGTGERQAEPLIFSLVGVEKRREREGWTRGDAAERRRKTFFLFLSLLLSQARCSLPERFFAAASRPSSVQVALREKEIEQKRGKERGRHHRSMLHRRFVFSFFRLYFSAAGTTNERARTRKTSCAMERRPCVKRGMKESLSPQRKRMEK